MEKYYENLYTVICLQLNNYSKKQQKFNIFLLYQSEIIDTAIELTRNQTNMDQKVPSLNRICFAKTLSCSTLVEHL